MSIRMIKYPYAPEWVNVIYTILEYLDYKIVSPMSCRLVWWRTDLLDRYCKCPQCIKRQEEASNV